VLSATTRGGTTSDSYDGAGNLLSDGTSAYSDDDWWTDTPRAKTRTSRFAALAA